MMSNLSIRIIWTDETREPLKADVASIDADNGFLVIELPADMLAKGVNSRMLMFPAHVVTSVEVEEREETKSGYREESTFRESPEHSRWFAGMGSSNGGENAG